MTEIMQENTPAVLENEKPDAEQSELLEQNTGMVYRGYRLPFRLVGKLYELAAELNVPLDKALEIAVYTGALSDNPNQNLPDESIPSWAKTIQTDLEELKVRQTQKELRADLDELKGDEGESNEEIQEEIGSIEISPLVEKFLKGGKNDASRRDYLKYHLAPENAELPPQFVKRMRRIKTIGGQKERTAFKDFIQSGDDARQAALDYLESLGIVFVYKSESAT